MRAIVVVSIATMGAFVMTAQVAPALLDLLIGRGGGERNTIDTAANGSGESAPTAMTVEMDAERNAPALEAHVGDEVIATPPGAVAIRAVRRLDTPPGLSEALSLEPQESALEAVASKLAHEKAPPVDEARPRLSEAAPALPQAGAESEASPRKVRLSAPAQSAPVPIDTNTEAHTGASEEQLQAVINALKSTKPATEAIADSKAAPRRSSEAPSSGAATLKQPPTGGAVESLVAGASLSEVVTAARPALSIEPVETTPSGADSAGTKPETPARLAPEAPGQTVLLDTPRGGVATHRVAKSKVNARLGPGLSYEVLTVLPLGARLVELPVGGEAPPNWRYFVILSGSFAGQTVWVHHSLVAAARR